MKVHQMEMGYQTTGAPDEFIWEAQIYRNISHSYLHDLSNLTVISSIAI